MKRILIILMLISCTISYAQKVDSYYDNGRLIQFYDTDSITVSVNLEMIRLYGKYYSLNIAIYNKKDKRVDFNPSDISLVSMRGQKIKYLKVFSNEDFCEKIKNRQSWEELFTGISVGLQNVSNYYTPSATINVSGSKPIEVYDFDSKNASAKNTNRQLEKYSSNNKKAIVAINEGYLKRHTLFANTGIVGYMNAEFKDCDALNLQISIGGVAYQFEWQFKSKKSIANKNTIDRFQHDRREDDLYSWD